MNEYVCFKSADGNYEYVLLLADLYLIKGPKDSTLCRYSDNDFYIHISEETYQEIKKLLIWG